MPTATLEELERWFNELSEQERICRTWVKTEAYSHICARQAVGINRMEGGRNAPLGLVCERHKPSNPEWFVRLRGAE